MSERLESEAKAAWDRYGSTVRMGGTPEQRRWALDQALAAEGRLPVAPVPVVAVDGPPQQAAA